MSFSIHINNFPIILSDDYLLRTDFTNIFLQSLQYFDLFEISDSGALARDILINICFSILFVYEKYFYY